LLADGVVIPQPGEGNASGLPFGWIGYQRMQQVISAQTFGTDPILISGIAFREDSVGGFNFVASATYQINLSTTSKQPDSLSPVFAENVGPDETIVRPAAVTGFLGSYLPGVIPQHFDSVFNFSRPFLYDPKAGNLLVEMRSSAVQFVLPSTGPAAFDAHYQLGDGVSWLLGNAVDSTTGTPETWGYVMALQYNAVPEPSTLGLFSIGALIVGWFYRNSNRHKG